MVSAFSPKNPALDLCQTQTTERIFCALTKHNPRLCRIPRGCGAGLSPLSHEIWQPVRGFAEAQGPPVPRMSGTALPGLAWPSAQAAGQRRVTGMGQVTVRAGWEELGQRGAGGPRLSLNGPKDVGWGCSEQLKSLGASPRRGGWEEAPAWTPGMAIPALGGALPGSSPPRGGVGTCHLLWQDLGVLSSRRAMPTHGCPFVTGTCHRTLCDPKISAAPPQTWDCPSVAAAQPSLCQQPLPRAVGAEAESRSV